MMENQAGESLKAGWGFRQLPQLAGWIAREIISPARIQTRTGDQERAGGWWDGYRQLWSDAKCVQVPALFFTWFCIDRLRREHPTGGTLHMKATTVTSRAVHRHNVPMGPDKAST